MWSFVKKHWVPIVIAASTLVAAIVLIVVIAGGNSSDDPKLSEEEAKYILDEINSAEPELEEYQPSVLYSEDVSPDLRLGVTGSGVGAADVLGKITFTTELGDEPALRAVEENGVCRIYADGGFDAGGVYRIALPDGMHFEGMAESVREYSFRVHKDEVQDIHLSESIKYIDRRDISVNGEGHTFMASAEAFEKYGFAEGDVLCIGDSSERLAGDFSFVKISDIVVPELDVFIVSYEDCEASDVYEDIDLFVRTSLTSAQVEDLFDAETIKTAVMSSGLREDMTRFLAGALSSDPTYLGLAMTAEGTQGAEAGAPGSMPGSTMPLISTGTPELILLGAEDGYISDNDFSANVHPDGDPVQADFDDLLKGVSVNVTIAKVDNQNFSIPDPDGWVAISITFTYEATLRQKVKLHAELSLIESVNVSAQGYAENRKGMKDFDFDFALNFYTQTDIKGTILVCSTNAVNEARGSEWINITDEIGSLIGGEDDSDADTLIARMQEMLDSKGDYVKLLEVPVMAVRIPVPPVLPIFQLNIKVNLVLKVNFAAGLSSTMSVLDATQVGIRGSLKDMKIKGYTNALAEGDRYSYNLEVCGYVGLRAGLQGELTLSLAGLDALGEIGAAIEVGAYTDLYGYADLSIVKSFSAVPAKTTLRGGYYMSVGIYGSIYLVAESSAFKVEADLTLVDLQIPLFTLGRKDMLVSVNRSSGKYFMHADNIALTKLIPLTGRFLDITTGEVHEGPIPADAKFACLPSNGRFTVPAGSASLVYTRDDKDRRHTDKTKLKLYYKGQGLVFGDSLSSLTNAVYAGEYEICWIAPEAEISEDDFGKLVKANYFINTGDENIIYGTRDVEVGTIPGMMLCEDESFLANYDWNIDPQNPIDADTDFVMTGSPRSVLVSAVWYENEEWHNEVRAVRVGDTPELPDIANACDYARFKGWRVSYGSAVSSEAQLQSGVVTAAAAVPGGCLRYYCYLGAEVQPGELVYECTQTSGVNAVNQFLGVGHETESGAMYTASSLYAVYMAEYDFESFTVTFNSKAQYGYDTIDKTEVQTVRGGKKPIAPSYGVPYGARIMGWDSNGDGGADYSTNMIPVITSDMTFDAVYVMREYDVIGMNYDVVNDTYTEKHYRVTADGRGIDALTADLLKPLMAPKGYSVHLVNWEIGLPGRMNTYDSIIGFFENGMIIKPVFSVYVDVMLDPGEGHIYYMTPTGSYPFGSELELPMCQLAENELHGAIYARWMLEEDGAGSGAAGGSGSAVGAGNTSAGSGAGSGVGSAGTVGAGTELRAGEIYEAGTRIKLVGPMKFKAVYEITETIYKASVSIASTEGILPNGQRTDSYEGDYAGYLEFIEKYNAYDPEPIVKDGYVHRLSKENTAKYTTLEDGVRETFITLIWFETPEVLTLTFDAGEGHFIYGDGKTAYDVAYYGSTYKMSRIESLEPLAREDERYIYALRGWTDRNGNFYGTDDTYLVNRMSESVVFTAVWEVETEKPEIKAAEFTITLSAGSGHFTNPGNRREVTVTITEGDSLSFGDIIDTYGPVREDFNHNYYIDCWIDEIGNYYDQRAFIYPSADETYTAMWIYDDGPAQQGSGTHNVRIFIDGTLAYNTTAAVGDQVRYVEMIEGTAFGGHPYYWSSEPGVSFAKNDKGVLYFIMPDGDITIYGTLAE